MMNTMHKHTALGAVLLLLLAACPGDDTGGDTAGDAASTSTTAAASTGEPAGSTGSDGAATETGEPRGTSTGTPPGGSSSSGGDGSGSGSTGGAGLEITGDWFEVFGPMSMQTHVIDETTWTQSSEFGTSVYHVESWDNAMGVVVAQGDSANDFYPDLYSRFQWTWDGPDLYYCTAVFDAATADDAWNAPGADAMDLAMGCGGFPWSQLMPAA